MKKTTGRNNGFLHYLPYSKEDEKLGMICTTAGNLQVPPNGEYPYRKKEHPVPFNLAATGRVLPEFQILYIFSGKGTLDVADKNWEIIPGSMIFLPPGLQHSYRPAKDTGWHEYWVGFKGSYFTKLHHIGLLSEKNIFFNIGLHDYIVDIYTRIFEEVSSQRPLFQMKACTAILELITEMLSVSRRREQSNYSQQIVEKAKGLMQSNILSTINIPNIANQINISTSRLNEIFRKYTSMSPYQYYIHLKIHKAAEFLHTENISVKEVAFRTGFDDQNYFSRLFKSKTGIAPSDWKKYCNQKQGYA
jgi:AraC-like DNA-binding protein